MVTSIAFVLLLNLSFEISICKRNAKFECSIQKSHFVDGGRRPELFSGGFSVLEKMGN